ncbi:MAG: hypothetical protein ACRCX2_37030 [Paraclostridium sp.]
MKIISSRTPERDGISAVNDYLMELNEENAFVRVLSGKIHSKIFNSHSSSSISSFKNKFNLNLVEGNSLEFYNQYLKLLNNFIEYNEVSVHAVRSEVFCAIISSLEKKTTKKIILDYENLQTVELLSSDLFGYDLVNISKANDTYEQMFEFLKQICNETGVEKISNETKNIINRNSKSLITLLKAIARGMKNAAATEDEVTFSGNNYDDMSTDQKVEWLKKFSPDTNLIVIDAIGTASKFIGSDYNSIFNPEFTTLNKLSEKYKSFSKSLELNSQNCSIYKTLAYLAIFLGREKIDCAPTEYMRKMINRDTRWATGTEATHEPSFYGDSDVWKAIYGYAPFMRGEVNPFKEIINNTQVDDMDKQALLMHRWFSDNGLSDLIYNLIYEKDLVGDKSLYELIGTAKELIKLLEEPIVCSSALDNLTASIKGIVSGMINTFVSTIDIAISGVARELFYKKFIPTGKEKISLAEFHDYLAFISAILKQYEDGAPTSTIDKDSFVNKIYESIGSSNYSFQACGYGAFDTKMNTSFGIDVYNLHLTEINKDEIFTLSRHMKLTHALVIFATQKESKKYGSGYVSSINYGDKFSVDSIIKKLTKDEIYYVFKTFGVDFYKIDDEFEDYTFTEILEYNDTLRDAQLYSDLDYKSTGFYDTFVSYDKAILSVERKQDSFSECNYQKYISKSLVYYYNIVKRNKNNLAKAILDSNNVSDVDDFLLRFLPSFNEIARTLGLNTGTVGALVKMIDYICEFITSVLFNKLYMEIKGFINDYVKSITDDIFTMIDSVGEKLGMSSGMVIKFEFGGRFISGKLDSLMKVLDDFTLTASFLDKCFTYPDLDSVDLDDIIDNSSEFSDNNFDVDLEGEGDLIIKIPIDKPSVDDDDDNYIGTLIPNPEPPKEEDLKIKIEITDKGFVEKVIEGVIDKKDPPKYITFEKGDITVTTEKGDKVTIVSKDDKKDSSLTITQDTYDKIESEIVSKNEIDQLIEIRDFVNNITNKVIIDLQDELNKTKNAIQEELDKKKPDNAKLNELVKKEQGLIDEMDSVKNKSGVKTSNFSSNKYKELEEEEVILHDYANGDLDLNKITAILEDLDDFTKVSKIPLTTSQIMELLK